MASQKCVRFCLTPSVRLIESEPKTYAELRARQPPRPMPDTYATYTAQQPSMPMPEAFRVDPMLAWSNGTLKPERETPPMSWFTPMPKTYAELRARQPPRQMSAWSNGTLKPERETPLISGSAPDLSVNSRLIAIQEGIEECESPSVPMSQAHSAYGIN